MTAWFNALTQVQQIMALIAVPATAVMIIQTILLLFGIGDGDADGDGVPDAGSDDGFSLFSIRGIIAMLTVGGWSGIVMIDAGMHPIPACILAALAGVAALIGMTLLIRLLLRLQSSGNIELSNAIGKIGQVYLPVPADMKGSGKIMITIQDKYSEIPVVTRDPSDIQTGEMVRVVAVNEAGVLIVERTEQSNK